MDYANLKFSFEEGIPSSEDEDYGESWNAKKVDFGETSNPTKNDSGEYWIPIPSATKGDSSGESWNPMKEDYLADVGFTNADPVLALKGLTMKEGRIGDEPCRFHDGTSGTCWKGDTCPYSHAKYTGGEFAKKFPELAFAATQKIEATPVNRLPRKPIWNNEREIRCRVTYVKNPSEFFLRPVAEDDHCSCQKLEKKIVEQLRKEQASEPEEEHPMDPYYYGHTALEPLPEGAFGYLPQPILTPSTLETRLTAYLNSAFRYKKLQTSSYTPKAELVAVRKPGGLWQRAFVQALVGKESGLLDRPGVYARLLDTGERLVVPMKDVCRLPEQFCYGPAAAFRCLLFRVQPTWMIWAKKGIRIFKELVEDKDLLVIVKDGPGTNPELHGSTYMFETTPYSVKILIDSKGTGEEWVDVADKLIETGYALEWNPLPFRPFAAEAVKNLSALEFLFQPVPPPLPRKAVTVENKRLKALQDHFKDEEKGIDAALLKRMTKSPPIRVESLHDLKPDREAVLVKLVQKLKEVSTSGPSVAPQLKEKKLAAEDSLGISIGPQFNLKLDPADRQTLDEIAQELKAEMKQEAIAARGDPASPLTPADEAFVDRYYRDPTALRIQQWKVRYPFNYFLEPQLTKEDHRTLKRVERELKELGVGDPTSGSSDTVTQPKKSGTPVASNWPPARKAAPPVHYHFIPDIIRPPHPPPPTENVTLTSEVTGSSGWTVEYDMAAKMDRVGHWVNTGEMKGELIDLRDFPQESPPKKKAEVPKGPTVYCEVACDLDLLGPINDEYY